MLVLHVVVAVPAVGLRIEVRRVHHESAEEHEVSDCDDSLEPPADYFDEQLVELKLFKLQLYLLLEGVCE